MEKDFTDWHEKKSLMHAGTREPFFYEQEVWWVALGCNVGHEEDGKNGDYTRPCLILRKFNKNLFLGVPLTSKHREGEYFYPFKYADGVDSIAMLSQVRALSSARLLRKDGAISQADYAAIQAALTRIINKETPKK